MDLTLACRAPISKACVWGRIYFPLTLGVVLVVLGGVVTALLYGCSYGGIEVSLATVSINNG